MPIYLEPGEDPYDTPWARAFSYFHPLNRMAQANPGSNNETRPSDAGDDTARAPFPFAAAVDTPQANRATLTSGREDTGWLARIERNRIAAAAMRPTGQNDPGSAPPVGNPVFVEGMKRALEGFRPGLFKLLSAGSNINQDSLSNGEGGTAAGSVISATAPIADGKKNKSKIGDPTGEQYAWASRRALFGAFHPVHQEANQRALSRMGVDSEQLAIINASTEYIDSPQYQDHWRAHVHAMSPSYESAEASAMRADAFARDKFVWPERKYPGDDSDLYRITQQAYAWYLSGKLPEGLLFGPNRGRGVPA